MSKIQLGDQEVEIKAYKDGAEIAVGGSVLKVDEQGDVISAEAYGNKLESVEGGMLLTRNGMKILIREDGSASYLTPPKSIGIKDLSMVQSYEIEKKEGKTIHRITFEGEGTSEIIYNEDGSYSSMSGGSVGQHVNDKMEVLLVRPEPLKE